MQVPHPQQHHRAEQVEGDVATLSLRFAVVFLALVVLLYPLGLWLLLRFQRASPLMLTVGVAAIGACLICRRNPASLGWNWGDWKYQYQSYLIPLAYVALAYLGVWLSGFGGWYDLDFVNDLRLEYTLPTWSDSAIIALHFVLTGTVSFILLLPAVLGEEAGWRGLLAPALASRFSFTQVSLVSGLLWSMFHWPLMVLGFYGPSETPLAYQLTLFTLCLVSMSFVMTYIRYKTDSLWPAVTFHMSHNVFAQEFFTPLTEESPSTVWFTEEFGLALPLAAMAFGLFYWRKGIREFVPASR